MSNRMFANIRHVQWAGSKSAVIEVSEPRADRVMNRVTDSGTLGTPDPAQSCSWPSLTTTTSELTSNTTHMV